jgi:hypothetical protein
MLNASPNATWKPASALLMCCGAATLQTFNPSILQPFNRLQYLVPELQAVVVVLQRLARHTSCDPLALQPFNPSTTVELKSQLWFLSV